MPELTTPRLRLRQWRDEDRSAFAQMNADPEVMRHFPATLSRAQSDELVDGAHAAISERGWGLWAVEVRGAEGELPEPGPSGFGGFIGLAVPSFEAHFTPAVEVGWRLAEPFWGRGYATEGARAAVGFAFGELGLKELVSFTTTGNERSRRVMARLGMTHDPAEDFDHPRVFGPLRRHVLYCLPNPDA